MILRTGNLRQPRSQRSNQRAAQGSRLKALGHRFGLQPPASSLQPRGLTLVEVLVSVAILSTGAVLLMEALARISHTQMVAEDRATATLFAASKLAEVELAFQEHRDAEEPMRGSLRIGDQAFEWHVSRSPPSDGSTVQPVVLAVAWRRGLHTFEQQWMTWLYTAEPSP